MDNIEQHKDFILDVWTQFINEEISFNDFTDYAKEYAEDNYLG